MNVKHVKKLVAVATLVVMLPGCASYRLARRADQAVKSENWDAVVYYYLEGLARDPGNTRYKVELHRARLKAGEGHFRIGMRFKAAGQLERAQAELELAVQLDPTNQYAEVELRKVHEDLRILEEEGGAQKLAAIKKAAADMKVKPPALNPASDEPLSLSFPNQTDVHDIYKAIGQAFGFNILFDPKMKETKISIELKNVNARQALEAVVQAAAHFYKVMDEKSIIVVEDTPQNRRDYEDLVVKTFFLSNADVKDVNNMLRTLIEARRLAINEQLNSIVIRDTADKVAIAERLIAANDKAKAEVLIDVELIQIDSTKTREFGTSLSSYSYTPTLDATKVGGTDKGSIPLPRLGDISRSMWSMVLPTVTVNLIKSAGEAETLAQPQLRITEREKASLVIGDQVPIPTTSFNTSQTVGGNIVPITAYQYKDVGIKIDIEPKVHHNNEVTLKLKVELSEKLPQQNEQTQPSFGTRTIDSTIRLKNGETSLLAGLFKYNRSENQTGVPWLSDLPVIGSIFGNRSRELRKTDLVLTLTPHIIRNPDITEEDLAPLWVGTENRVTIFGNSPRVRSAVQTGPLGGELEIGLNVMADQPPRSSPRLRDGGRRERQVVPPGGQPQGPGTSNEQPDTLPEGASVEVETPQRALMFSPERLPVVVGQEGDIEVVLEPGQQPMLGPINLAYDPLRLEVTRIEGMSTRSDAGVRSQVSHAQAMGWITIGWDGELTTETTIARLRVRPRELGEFPIVFGGPAGVLTPTRATVVGIDSTGERKDTRSLVP